MHETIKVEVKDKIAFLTLNRPDKLNAINNKLIEEMVTALDVLNNEKNVRVIILTGEGKAFCAGGDLIEAASMGSPLESFNWLKKAQKVQISIEESPKVIICCINGAAMGGGLELALACDIRITSSNAVFAVPEINAGLLPGGGGMTRLASLIGLGRAKEMVLSGRKVSAEEALSIGLVSEIVERNKLLDRVVEYAQELAQKPPIGLALAKDTIVSNLGVDYKTGLNNEAKALWILFATKDRLEGLQAFKERRQPVFIGE